MVSFSVNPILFKIKYINRDVFDTTTGISGVLGKAFHLAMQVYFGGTDTVAITSEAEAIEYGLKAGTEYLETYNDGFIEYTKTIPCKQKAIELLTFCFNSYVKESKYEIKNLISTEEKIEEKIDVEWKGKKLSLPIKLKGYTDRVEMSDNKLRIIDYKTCYKFSDLDRVDGAKIIQAITYYLLVYAKTGIEPYSMIYEEVKYTKNQDSSPQVKRYEIVYADNELYFDFYFRLYEDIVRALNGEMVYVPNVNTLYDNEVAIISYIHRLDISEETAKLMKKHKVENLTDLLKKEIQSAGSMRQLMKATEEKFVSAKNIDYEKMTMEEKIQMKLLEFGIMLQFDSKKEGNTVDLYCYTPSIGVKMARLRNFVDDIEQVTGIAGIRVLAPIPGTKLVGFEIPKQERLFVTNTKKSTDLAIGIDTMGERIELVIEDMPHLLVAGTTGSGKSVFLSEVVRQMKKKFDIHVIDPKGIDFDWGMSDKNYIAGFLQGIVEQMNVRHDEMKSKGFKKWSQTGNKSTLILIDEYNDLFMCKDKIQIGEREETKVFARETKTVKVPVYDTIGNYIDRNIKVLAQKARSAGIHIILATQRPSVKVLDGDIKANFSTRISFRLPTVVDSKVVLDGEGAEKLLGKGDGLLLKDGTLTRFQAFSN